MEKKNLITTIIIYCSIALFVVLIALGINYLIEKNKESKKNDVTEQLIELGVDEDDALNMDIDEARDYIDAKLTGNSGYTYDKSKEEYPDSDTMLERIDKSLVSGNYKDVVTAVSAIKDKYNFTTVKNANIINAYTDANELALSGNWEEEDYDEFLNSSKNPTAFLKAFLETPTKDYTGYCVDTVSLMPIYLSNNNFNTVYYEIKDNDSVNKLKQEKYFANIENIYSNYTEIARINVSGTSDNFSGTTSCFVGNIDGSSLVLLGCYDTNDSLFTIAEWAQIKP